MRIGIICPDGVGIKNYLYSDLISKFLKNNHQIIILHNLSNKAIEEVERLHNFKSENYLLPKFKENFYQKFLRELICLSRLKFNSKVVSNNTILTNWKPNRKGFGFIFYKAIEFLSFFFNSYRSILFLEKKYQNSLKFSIKAQESLLLGLKLDKIFNLHQRSLLSIPIVKAAKKLNIETIGAIFSWDNLPKARLSVRTDKYFVWSKHMESEFKTFYPEINLDKIIITGTPQFEFYHQKELYESKEVFFKKHDLDLNRRVVCFSGCDELTSPFDHKYLGDLAEEIDKIPEDIKPQILFRRSPADFSKRYNDVINDFKHLIKVSNPDWYINENWAKSFSKFNDVKLLLNTTMHCDCVVNIGSTMALDFGMNKKSAIYINYEKKDFFDWSITILNSFQHFRSMGKLNPVIWLNSKGEINRTILNAFDENLSKKNIEDCETWIKKLNNIKTSTEKIYNEIILK